MCDGNFLTMDEGAFFIESLKQALRESGLSEAELSVKAGLNRRAVTDLREGRVQSPKISTVFRLANALNLDPGEMMGLGKRPDVNEELARFLEAYPKEEQLRFLAVLQAVKS